MLKIMFLLNKDSLTTAAHKARDIKLKYILEQNYKGNRMPKVTISDELKCSNLIRFLLLFHLFEFDTTLSCRILTPSNDQIFYVGKALHTSPL